MKLIPYVFDTIPNVMNLMPNVKLLIMAKSVIITVSLL